MAGVEERDRSGDVKGVLLGVGVRNHYDVLRTVRLSKQGLGSTLKRANGH